MGKHIYIQKINKGSRHGDKFLLCFYNYASKKDFLKQKLTLFLWKSCNTIFGQTMLNISSPALIPVLNPFLTSVLTLVITPVLAAQPDLLGQQKITQLLRTKKITKRLSGQKKFTQPLGTKKSPNLLGQKKITQPFGTKKNHPTYQDKKKSLNLWG